MKAFIPCVAGQNPFAECLVEARGNLIRFAGHAAMEFAPADALRLAELLQQWATPLAGPRAAEVDPSEGEEQPLVKMMIDRFRALFPAEQFDLQQGDVDLKDLAESARDLCLSLAMAVEILRQRYARMHDDGR